MKKLTFWIVILLLIVAGIVGYNRYMSGNLKIDRELVSEENLNLLADNWEKLVENQKLMTGQEARVSEDGTIEWAAIIDEKALAFFTVMSDADSDAVVDIVATYHRSGVKEWLDEFAAAKEFSRFGESTNHIYVCNSRFEIIYLEYEAEANADNFEAWFRELLETAKS